MTTAAAEAMVVAAPGYFKGGLISRVIFSSHTEYYCD